MNIWTSDPILHSADSWRSRQKGWPVHTKNALHMSTLVSLPCYRTGKGKKGVDFGCIEWGSCLANPASIKGNLLLWHKPERDNNQDRIKKRKFPSILWEKTEPPDETIPFY